MSKVNGLNHLERFGWVLLQSLWVGGIWITILVIYPALNKSLLAPILVYGIIAELGPKIILATVICSLLQLALFIKGAGLLSLIKSPIGQSLLLVVSAGLVFLVLHHSQMLGHRLHIFLYLSIGLFGVFLMFHLPPWLQKQREVFPD